jgi:hypothetical protein
MEHLTISKAKIMREQLVNELDLYLEQKEINFIKMQPESPVMRDIIEGKSDSFKISDKFTHYVIKDEKLDEKIFALQREINALERYIIKEMERINKAGGNYLIRYYRDVEHFSWNKISRLTNYSLRQCHRLYNKKEEINSSQFEHPLHQNI